MTDIYEIRPGDVLERELPSGISRCRIKKKLFEGIYLAEEIESGEDVTLNVFMELTGTASALFRCEEASPDRETMRGLVGKRVRFRDGSEYLVLGFSEKFGRPYVTVACGSDGFSPEMKYMSAEDLSERTYARKYVRADKIRLSSPAVHASSGKYYI